MASLSDFLGSVGEEAGNIAESYLKASFFEKAIQIDEFYDQQFEEQEEQSLEAAREEYETLATTGRGEFVKAALIPRDDTYSQDVDAIKFMFNPTELNISRQVNVTEMKGARTSQGLPKVSYGSIDPYQIELAGLLFDTYEQGTNVLDEIQPLRDAVDFTKFGTRKSYVSDDGSVDFISLYARGSYASLINIEGDSATEVATSLAANFSTAYSMLEGDSTTDAITSQSEIDELGSVFREYDDLQDVPLVSKHPPVYYFIWGDQNYMTCMITKLTYKLTMFLPDGTPVRALVDISLKEVDMREASRKFSDMQNITS